MKKLLGFIVVMFAVTTQNAMGEHFECINFTTNWGDNVYRCENLCKKREGIKTRVLIPSSKSPNMTPQDAQAYQQCVIDQKGAACFCSQ